jgi:hypothetical protein
VQDVTPGAFGLARVDLVMANDVSGSVAIREFERIGAERVLWARTRLNTAAGRT